MSQPADEAINAGGPPEWLDTGARPYRPAQSQTPHGPSGFGDSSGPIFSMYGKTVEEEDNKITERWQKDADGILIFAGLFSAAVAALVSVSIQDLRPDPQATTAFYLANIYQLLAEPNASRASLPPTLINPPTFSPPRSAVWVNSLWFLSLAISLTCALLATLLQQWARRYLGVTQPPRCSPHKRAWLRAFFADGVDRLHVPRAVEALPALLHLSLFSFFVGLLIFLASVDHTVFNSVVWWVGLSAGVYVCITFMPIFRHDSPYYAPLSSTIWFVYTGTVYVVFIVLQVIASLVSCGNATWRYIDDSKGRYRRWFLQGLKKTVGETALEMSSVMDGRVLRWTFDALDEDDELEQFFAGIPGFCSSTLVENPQLSLDELNRRTLAGTLYEWLDRTWSSNLVPEPDKTRRLIIGVCAIDAARLSYAAWRILDDIFFGKLRGVLPSLELGHSLRRVNGSTWETPMCAQTIVSGVIASTRERDGRWIALAVDQLRKPEGVIRGYLAHGDSVLLANLVHLTRQMLLCLSEGNSNMAFSSAAILPKISHFDVSHTLPELQQDFCILWNRVVLEARKTGAYSVPIIILIGIRNVYIVLHQGSNAAPTAFSASTDDDDVILRQPTSYPLCNLLGHRYHIHRGDITHSPANTPIVRPPTRPEISVATHLDHIGPRPQFAEEFPSGGMTNTLQHIISVPAPTAAGATEALIPHSLPSLATLSNDIVPPQHGPGLDVVPPLASRVPISSLPMQVLDNTVPSDPQTSSIFSPPQSDQPP